MESCARCGTRTDAGENYRFYYGIVDDDGPEFHATGSEEAYFCDRCLVQAVAREERNRAGFYLAVEMFALAVAVSVAWTSSRGLWACLLALLIIGGLGGAAWRRYRQLRSVLRGGNLDDLRSTVGAHPKIRDAGDDWAIRRRRSALQQQGAQLFVTRSEYEHWRIPPAGE